MSLLGSARRFGLITQALHWLTAILVVWAWLIAGTWGRDESSTIMALHQTLGFTVFVLVAVRLVWRFFDPRPQPVEMPGLMTLAGKASHWLLFALMVAIPLSAIVGSWFEGHAITLYGNAIGPLLTTDRRLGHQILEVHQLMGTTLMWVAGLHAAAAIYHHVLLKDRVLRQMLPVG